MYSRITIPSCPSCHQLLEAQLLDERPRSFYKRRKNRQPHLLNCGHNICEDCLRTVNQFQTSVQCTICLVETPFLDSSSDAFRNIPVDAYATGVIVTAHQARLPENFIPQFVPASLSRQGMQSQGKYSASALASKSCDECSVKPAVWKCKQCLTYLCNVCYPEVHKMKTLNHHEPVALFQESGTRLTNNCELHHLKLDFYCEDDDELVCSHCIILGNHEGHSSMLLKDKNLQYLNDLKTSFGNVQKVVKRLKKAEKVLQTTTQHPTMRRSHVVDDIHAAFQHLHGILQVREQALVDKAEELCRIHNSPIEKLKMELSDTLKFTKMLLADAEEAMMAPQSFNMSLLLQKLNQVATEAPCYLIDSGQQLDANDDNLNFEMDLSLVKQLFHVGEITGNAHIRYKLCSAKELPATTNLDSDETEDNLLDDDGESSVTSDATSSTVLSSLHELELKSSVTPLMETKTTKLHHFKNEMVTVTHINSPSDFYVHRLSTVTQLKNLTNVMNVWCQSTSAEPVTQLERDDFVLAQYTADDEWYRGQILVCIPDPDTNLVASVKVCYIDFGNSEIIPISRLRKMETRFLDAVHETTLRCALHDISPVGEEWTEEATSLLQQFVIRQQLNLIVFEEHAGFLHVDLRRMPLLKDIKNDAPISAREALVFLHHAYFLSPDAKQAMARRQCQQSYHPDVKSKLHSTFKVMVCFAKTPHKFYVHRMDECNKYLNNLTFELQEMYSNPETSSQWSIFCPRRGMPCVAQYSHDQQWYRAKIESEPVKSMVQVTFVDFGNKETVEWTSIRKIADKFLKLPVQANLCRLMDVARPEDSKSWPKEVREAFDSIVNNKKLEVTVKEESEKGLGVLLYEDHEDCRICINALLVEQGLAKSTGPNSTLVTFPKEIKVPKEMKVPKQQLTATPKSPQTVSQDQTARISDWDMTDFTVLKVPGYPDMIPVIVSHLDSPTTFYVQLCGSGEEDLLTFSQDMQKSYRNTKPVSNDWKESDLVAARYSVNHRWCRARIMDIKENMFTVLYIDYGYTEDVDPKELRLLLEKHHTSHAFAIPCTLTDIIPAGGTKKWTTTACQYLKDSVDKYSNIYLARKASVQNNYMAVDLYAHVEEPTKALEPQVMKYLSLTEDLIANGMALPARRKVTSPQGDGICADGSASIATSANKQLLNALSEYTEIKGLDGVDLIKLESMSDNPPPKSPQTVPKPVAAPSEATVPTPQRSTRSPRPNLSATSTPKSSPRKSRRKSRSKAAKVSRQATEASAMPKKLPVADVDDEDFVDFDELSFSLDESLERYNCPEAAHNDVLLCSGNSESAVRDLDVLAAAAAVPASQVCPSPLLGQQQTVWKRPAMPAETVFAGTITYLDYDGCFYVHAEEAEPTLEYIKNTLRDRYQNSAPECHDLYWCIDEPCIAQYELDGHWYRGQVKSIGDKGVEVIFIDYGNAEDVPHHKLRKKLACTGFPRQSFRCSLHGIEPHGEASLNGKWNPAALDLIHKYTVDKKAIITLKEPPEGEPLHVSLKLKESGNVVEDFLIECNLAMKVKVARKLTSPVDVQIKDSQDPGLTIPHFKQCRLPPVDQSFPAIVIEVEFPKLVWLQRNVVPSPQTKYENCVYQQSKILEKLNDTLTEKAPNWPRPKTVNVGDAICGKFSERWYRASVRQITPNGYMVLFVDYGNCEMVSKKELRTLPDECMELPMQAVQCELHQVFPKSSQWSEEIYQQLKSSLIGEIPSAVIRETRPPMKVDLFKPDDQSEYLYQELIENEIIMLVREKTPEECL